MESTGNVENVRGIRVRNDRVFPETRWVSVIIVPFLVAAFVILYLFPDRTQDLFAWGIQPRMSAMMLGAAYIGGAYFFVRAAANAPWHSWAVVACGGMSIGHKGMLFAAKSLAMTMVDMFENENLLKEIRTEFEQKRNNHIYKAYIPDGPPPVPAQN